MQSPASRSRCFAPRLPLPPPRITRGRNQHPGRIRTVSPSYVLLSSARRTGPMPTRVHYDYQNDRRLCGGNQGQSAGESLVCHAEVAGAAWVAGLVFLTLVRIVNCCLGGLMETSEPGLRAVYGRRRSLPENRLFILICMHRIEVDGHGSQNPPSRRNFTYCLPPAGWTAADRLTEPVRGHWLAERRTAVVARVHDREPLGCHCGPQTRRMGSCRSRQWR